jgi:hypothetical protein
VDAARAQKKEGETAGNFIFHNDICRASTSGEEDVIFVYKLAYKIPNGATTVHVQSALGLNEFLVVRAR